MEAGLLDIADDALLAEACRLGDLAAFEQLVKRHQRMLLNHGPPAGGDRATPTMV